MAEFTHFDAEGKAVMVDIGDKAETERIATARATVLMNPDTLRLIQQGGHKKGDVLGVARLVSRRIWRSSSSGATRRPSTRWDL